MEQPSRSERPFSLAPAIFTRFEGLPNDAGQPSRPLEREEKLQSILENLGKQHEAVRKNMVLLMEQRAVVLVEQAQEELSRLRQVREEDFEDRDEDEVGGEELRRDLARMEKRVKVAARKDARPVDYQMKVGDLELQGRSTAPAKVGPAKHPNRDGDGDVEMSGTISVSRNGTAIRRELSGALRELVGRGVEEIGAYEVHAETVNKHYRLALARGNTMRGSMSRPVPVGGGGGILKNRHEESPVDREAIRRMSTGMPVKTSLATEPERTSTNYEAAVRRG